MTTKDRKIREHQKRERNILKAAEKILTKKGIKGLTIREVAKKTELSEGTLYLYYKNKDELIAAILLNNFVTLGQQLASIKIGKKRGDKYAWELFEVYFDFAKKYYQRFHLLHEYFENICRNRALKQSRILKELIEARNNLLSFFHHAIQKGVKDKSFRKDIDPRKATIVVGIITESFLDHILRFKHHKGIIKNCGLPSNCSEQSLIKEYQKLIKRAFESNQKY